MGWIELDDNLGRISIFNIFSPLIQKNVMSFNLLIFFHVPKQNFDAFHSSLYIFLSVNAKTVDQFIVFKIKWLSTKFSEPLIRDMSPFLIYNVGITFHFYEFYSCF